MLWLSAAARLIGESTDRIGMVRRQGEFSRLCCVHTHSYEAVYEDI